MNNNIDLIDKINSDDKKEIKEDSCNIINKKVILIVDDLLYIIKSIEKILLNLGYYVITAQTGLDALNKFESYNPDLITIDQKLPDMTGYQLAERIYNKKTLKKPKIIFISSVYDKEEIKSILHLGIDNYLLKPVTKSTLVETVKKIFELDKC